MIGTLFHGCQRRFPGGGGGSAELRRRTREPERRSRRPRTRGSPETRPEVSLRENRPGAWRAAGTARGRRPSARGTRWAARRCRGLVPGPGRRGSSRLGVSWRGKTDLQLIGSNSGPTHRGQRGICRKFNVSACFGMSRNSGTELSGWPASRPVVANWWKGGHHAGGDSHPYRATR
jgi:hypothetical protein